MLKAKWLQLNNNKKNSLYVYESRPTATGRSKKRYIKKTRSDAPFTHGLDYLAKQLVEKRVLDQPAFRNIELMVEFRNCATHFYNEDPSFETRLFEIGAACVKNFVNVVRDWFQREVSEFNVQLMPLTFMEMPRVVGLEMLNAEEKSFIGFVDSLVDTDADPESRYSVAVNVDLKFTRSRSNDAVAVTETSDPSALLVHLTEEDIRLRYQWDYATLTSKCRERFPDFKVNRRYHEIRKGLVGDRRFSHMRYLDPENPKSSRKTFFDPNIMNEFDKHYQTRP